MGRRRDPRDRQPQPTPIAAVPPEGLEALEAALQASEDEAMRLTRLTADLRARTLPG